MRTVDITSRVIRLAVTMEELANRRVVMEAKGVQAWKPIDRERTVSAALRAYAVMTTSASETLPNSNESKLSGIRDE